MFIKVIAVIPLALAILLVSFAPAYADSFSLSISPALTQIMVKPGKFVTQSFFITNHGDPTTITTSLSPFVPASDAGATMLIDCHQTALAYCQALNWIQASGPTSIGQPVFLKTNQTLTLGLTITPPAGATDADYYLTLLVGNEAARGEVGNSSRLIGQIGTNIIITVSEDGMISKQAKVAKFSIPSAIKLGLGINRIALIDSFDSIPLQLVVENIGSHVFTAQGQITLSAPYLPRIQFPLLPSNILSGSSRFLYTKHKKYTTTSYLPSLILPGSFYFGTNTLTARIVLEDIAGSLSAQGRSGKQPELTAQVIFIAFPMKATLVIVSGLLLFYLKLLGRKAV